MYLMELYICLLLENQSMSAGELCQFIWLVSPWMLMWLCPIIFTES